MSADYNKPFGFLEDKETQDYIKTVAIYDVFRFGLTIIGAAGWLVLFPVILYWIYMGL